MTEFADQDLPFKDGDNVSKPDLGVWLTMREDESDLTQQLHGVVVATFDSLSEDWGSYGETAWAQWDVNAEHGFKGRWYAILETEDPYDGYWSVASYEVLEIDQCWECDGRIGAAPKAEVVYVDQRMDYGDGAPHRIIHQSCFRTNVHKIA